MQNTQTTPSDTMSHLKRHIQGQTRRPLIWVAVTGALSGALFRNFLRNMETWAPLDPAGIRHTTLVAVAFLLGVFFGMACQAGRKQYLALKHRLPLDPTAALRHRVLSALRVGLPTWAVTSLLWIVGLPFEVWFPSLLMSTTVFVFALISAACILAPLLEGDNELTQFPLAILTLAAVAAAMFIPGLSWRFPFLANAIVIVACGALCALVWKFSLYLIRLNSQGLTEPPTGKPWWWPGLWHIGAVYYLYALAEDSIFTALFLIYATLLFALQVFTSWLQLQTERVEGSQDRPRTGLIFKALANLCLLLLSLGVVLYRLTQFVSRDVSNYVHELANGLFIEATQLWMAIMLLGLNMVIGLLMLSRTQDLFRALRRQDAMLQRLPALGSDIVQARRNQWTRRMRFPLLSWGFLDLAGFVVAYSTTGEWRWIWGLAVLQIFALALGYVAFRYELPLQDSA